MANTEEWPESQRRRHGDPFASFRIRNYRWLWAANVSHGLVQSSQRFAVLWLVIDTLNAGSVLLGLVALAVTLPALLLALPAGVLADRKDRRLLLATSHVLVAFALVIGAVLSGSQGASTGLVLVAALLGGVGVAVGEPVRAALIPAVVPRSRLLNANALYVLAQGAGAVVGPGLAGATIALWGVGSTFAVLAVVSLAGALFLIPLQVPPRDPSTSSGEGGESPQRLKREGMFADIATGFGFITSGTKELRMLFVLLLTASLLWPWLALDIGFVVKEHLHLGAGDARWLLTVMGVGGLATVAVLASTTRLSNAGGWYAVMLIGGAVLTAAVWFSSSYALVALLFFLFGLTLDGRGILFQTLVQSRVPISLMGRVMATYLTVLAGGAALGAVVRGAARNVLWDDGGVVFVAAVMVAVVAFVLVRYPGLRRMPSHPDEPETGPAEAGPG